MRPSGDPKGHVKHAATPRSRGHITEILRKDFSDMFYEFSLAGPIVAESFVLAIGDGHILLPLAVGVRESKALITVALGDLFQVLGVV